MADGPTIPRRRERPPIGDVAREIARTLRRAGFEALLAGGCVRDRLLGLDPKDYDIATDARPEDVRGLFRRVHEVGESFGVMLVRLRGWTVEVATFRRDGAYTDGRHPDEVVFSDAEHDARRRDFTINGLFEDPETGAVVDHVGGRADLEARVVRAIGDPHARLREDRLRMLRAIRFAARFGFAIESGTADAIRRGAGDLRGVSRERIGQEVRLMLIHANRAVAAWEMQYLGLDEAVLLEPHAAVAPTRLGRLPDVVPYPTSLAAWLLDRHEGGGPPDDERAMDLVDRARAWAAALVLSNDERDGVLAALRAYVTLRRGWSRLGVAAQKRLAASTPFAAGLALLQGTDRAAFIEVQRQVVRLAATGLAPEPLIDGRDLIELGLAPGPGFKRVLDGVYDAQLEGAVSDRDAALRLARVIASAG